MLIEVVMLISILEVILLGFALLVLCTMSTEETKLRRVISAVALCLLGFSIVSFALFGSLQRNQDMESFGITNYKECPIIILSSINITSEVHGTMNLFAGSIDGVNIRMEYVAPNGASYVISVPITKIKFLPKENATPSGSFHFTNWQKNLTLQDNVDEYLDKITINLAPDEFQKLIK